MELALNTLDDIIDTSLKLNNIVNAKTLLYSIYPSSDLINKSLDIAIKAHDGVFRQSGEPYSIHPIIVASYVAFLTNDETMICSALLHDVIEDTSYEKSHIEKLTNKNISNIVDGLTKIKSLDKKHKHDQAYCEISSIYKLFSLDKHQSKQVLLIKLCDRLHNMLTLSSMSSNKQIKKSKDTLSVFVPIAHMLGISKIKTLLEDLSFKYLLPKEYKEIDDFLTSNNEDFINALSFLIDDITSKLEKHSISKNDFDIEYRIKHKYSIHLKQQRKNIDISEVLDILAIRIILKNPSDCYMVLGIIHTNYSPIMVRFKDYIATPKENGYETIHTTILQDLYACEIQIRTFDMHKTAEFGVASHLKYKEMDTKEPELDWIEKLNFHSTKDNGNIDNIYELDESMREILKIDNIDVYSPDHTKFILPRTSLAIDFAYKIHDDIGSYAKYALVNGKRVSLLYELEHLDIVKIITDESKVHFHCSWANIVKTKKAKDKINFYCRKQLKKIDNNYGLLILQSIFNNKVSLQIIKNIIGEDLSKIPSDTNCFHKAIHKIDDYMFTKKHGIQRVLFSKVKIKHMKIDNFNICHNKNIKSINYDICCHPKKGDKIIGFLISKNIYVHNKMCNKAQNLISENKNCVLINWNLDNLKNSFELIIALQDKLGALLSLLSRLSKFNIDVKSIALGSENINLKSNNCQLGIESNKSHHEIEKILKLFHIVSLIAKKDPYIG